MSPLDQSDIENVETWSGKGPHDENFPVGSVSIARRYRGPMHRYYAFARNADDIADSPVLSPQDKITRLDIMEEVLLGRRMDGSPSATALRASLAETGVTPKHATDLLIAFRQDATKTRYATIDELDHYCQYSAAPVGRYVLDLHGESNVCYTPSDALCSALQILNHLQDCAKDLADLDRCYLPQALLEHFCTGVEDLRLGAETPALRRVFITLLERIDNLNRVGAALPELVKNVRLRIETAVICGLSRRLARRLADHDPVSNRVKLRKSDAVFSVLASVLSLV
jgi:hydroxysqualene synthase